MSVMSAAEAAALYREEIRPTYFRHSPAPQRSIVLLGGQPGAGKSVASARIRAERPDSVYISGDDLRAYVPGLRELVKNDPFNAPEAVKPFTAAWVRALIHDCRTAGHSLILEGTFHDLEVTRNTASEFAAAGYKVEVVAVGTPRHASLQSALDRPLREQVTSGGGRYTSLAHHDAGYIGTRKFLAEVKNIPAITNVRIIDRAGDIKYDATRTTNDQFEGALVALDESRAVTNANGVIWISQLRRTTEAAFKANAVHGIVKDYLTEMHHVALNEVIPALSLPESSGTRQALTDRTFKDLALIENARREPASTAPLTQSVGTQLNGPSI